LTTSLTTFSFEAPSFSRTIWPADFSPGKISIETLMGNEVGPAKTGRIVHILQRTVRNRMVSSDGGAKRSGRKEGNSTPEVDDGQLRTSTGYISFGVPG
jgi:hypothetical protein